jgi:hypothetical protein
MQRTVLRTAAVAALLRGGTGPPWPTIAEEYVYDSVSDDINDVSPAKRRPIIIVRTDEDTQTFRNNTDSGRQCRLLIEMSVVTAVQNKIPNWPTTDASLEAFLDMMEWQAKYALYGAGQWPDFYKRATRFAGVFSITSVPRYSPPDRGVVRLAVRTFEIVQRLSADCLPYGVNELAADPLPMLPPDLVAIMTYIISQGGGAFRTSIIKMAQMLHEYGMLDIPKYPAFQRVWLSLPDYGTEAQSTIEQLAHMRATQIKTEGAQITKPQLS